MRIQFYMGHPAHFHLLKNVIRILQEKNHVVAVLIKKKDILEDLLKNSGIPYTNILSEGRADSRLGIILGILKRDWRSFRFTRRFKPDILVGTSVENSHLSKFLRIPSVNLNEDDAKAVPLYARISYPWATEILTPLACDNGKWNEKSMKYAGYHELAYLHPRHFTPDKNIVKKYFNPDERYFILRFARLNAHHDKGVRGIDASVAKKLIAMLEPAGKVYITSERTLEPEFEPYRMNINPLDIHHVMAFASIYIGDSQTMAAEAGVLGIPYLRFNDFAGRLGYLNELENTYQLGYGIPTSQEEKLYTLLADLLANPQLSEEWRSRRNKMLGEKIDVASFLAWFIENYPQSKQIMRENPDEQFRFR